jgi:3' terminal RNA ribose 2'-O-methyltransferase Hen1
MFIRFEAKGKGADQLSYFLGKHPDHPFRRETKYGVVEFKFLRYEVEQVEGVFSFTPNGLQLVRESDFKNLEDYINDREFSLSTIFLTNVRHCIGHALNDNYTGNANIAISTKFDFKVVLGPISTKMSDEGVVDLFKPLGYEVAVNKVKRDYTFKVDSGNVIELNLTQKIDIVSLFKQIYVMIPVMDNYKHHVIEKEEADKLLRYGEGWLSKHPKAEFIAKRYVGYQDRLFEQVMSQLHEINENFKETWEAKEKKNSLGTLRYEAFVRHIEDLGVKQVVDMGAGEGRLIKLLVNSQKIKQLIACDPSLISLQKMKRNVEKWKKRGTIAVEPMIRQSSLFYQDETLINTECLVLCEVIEHINADRIDGVMETILNIYKPQHFLISTPNIEYNVLYENLEGFRHNDHRFEMTRVEFQSFIQKHATKNGYDVVFTGVGEVDELYGQSTQMAIMKRGTTR